MILRPSLFFFFSLLCSGYLLAQTTDTIPGVSVDPELEAIYQSKVPKEYTIAQISISGTASFDAELITSISGISVGDKLYLPGGDLFAKAIQALWKQQYFDDAAIYITKIDERNLSIEINVKERARLGAFSFKGIRKGE